MIVQCNECNARFKLDDSKVTETGVRVRCSKCKAVFVVKKEAPQEEDLDSLLSGLGGEEEAAPPAPAPVPPPEAAPAPGEFSFGIDQSSGLDVQAEPPAGMSEPKVDESGPQDFDFAEESFSSAAPQWDEPAAQQTGPADEFSFEESELPGETSHDFTGGAGEDSAFDFSGDLDSAPAAEPAAPASTGASDFSFEEEAFSFGDTPDVAAGGEKSELEPDLGEFNFGEPEDEKQAAPAEGSDFSFDFPSSPASDEKPQEFSFGEEEPAPKSSAAPEFDDFDLGLPPASTSAAPAPAVPEEKGFDELSPPAFSPVSDFAAGEAPPSAAGRRQESSGMKRILVALLVILVVAGGGFYVTKLSPAALDKIGLGAVAKRLGIAEEIRLEVRNVRGSYVRNPQAGELLVVRGEVANSGNRARTGIQVKASIFGKGGAEVAHRTAFCGNSLTDQQIASQPFAQLEKAMNDQFGKSLSNLGVEPGSSVPFVVVLNNVPQDAVQYGVELAASAPAGK